MRADVAATTPESKFTVVLATASRHPGVRIHRDAYLRRALARYCTDEEIREAIESTPAAAGISKTIIDKAAIDSIKNESAKVTGLSAAAGLPGGLAMIGARW
jgi:hypothetical protein